jgi:GNAT superfamily N-acetyltransferase
MFCLLPDIKLPEEMQTVHIDESWEPLILELCEDEEFSADNLRCQLRENLSLGLIHRGEMVGFMSTHLNGEAGPLWVAPEYRSENLGTAFLRDYLCEFFKSNTVAFGLSAPENHASARTMEKLGFKVWDKYVLLITNRRQDGH